MIRFENVGFRYDTDKGAGGVQHLDFEIPAGSCTLICGPSGCGKTTVTRLANGLSPAFYPGELRGRVLLDGRDISLMESWEVAANVGSVLQNPRTQFFNVDSTGEVAFSLESLSWPEEALRTRTAEVMTELGIGHLADRPIFSLSGGEKQSIAFGSAWAPRPTNLVLDEPTSNLDLDATRDLKRHICKAKEQGCAVLVAEHRLWWLADVADEVLVIENGVVSQRWSGTEFRALNPEELHRRGLRTRDLDFICAKRTDQKHASDPLLHATNLLVRHQGRKVLDVKELLLRRGEVAALVGPNGAGKTTLCRVLAGLHRKTDGTVKLAHEGNALRPAKPRDRLSAASMVFQDVNYQLFSETVRSEVAFGLKADEIDERYVDELLHDLGLENVVDRHPATLSGGQKQRLALAACLAASKSLVVFDEPTSGLDLKAMEEVASLMRATADAGAAVLVVTHDLELVASSCDRVIGMRDGSIIGNCFGSNVPEVRRLMSGSSIDI